MNNAVAELLRALTKLKWRCEFVPAAHFLIDGSITYGLADPQSKTITIAAKHPQWYAVLAHEAAHAAHYANDRYSPAWWDRYDAGDPEFAAHVEALAERATLDFLSTFSPAEVAEYAVSAANYIAKTAGIDPPDSEHVGFILLYANNVPDIAEEPCPNPLST
jgi:hypothetical protein